MNKKTNYEKLMLWLSPVGEGKDKIDTIIGLQTIVKLFLETLVLASTFGPGLGFLMLFAYCTKNNLPYFDASMGFGFQIAIIFAAFAFYIFVTAMIYYYGAIIRLGDKTGRIFLSSYFQTVDIAYHKINSQRFILLNGLGVSIYCWMWLAFDGADKLFISLFGLLFAVAFGVGFYTFYIRQKRIRWWLLKKDMGPIIFSNTWAMVVIAMTCVIAFNFIEKKFGDIQVPEFMTDYITASAVIICIIFSFLLVFFFTYHVMKRKILWASVSILMVSFVILMLYPGWYQITKNVIAETGHGGDVAVNILLKDATACKFRERINFVEEAKITEAFCQEINTRKVKHFWTKPIFLTWMSSNAAYVKSDPKQVRPMMLLRSEILSWERAVLSDKGEPKSEPQ
ncbi:hypothetical protein GCM10011332_21140 [Terasakiella brassicae]|uniref:Uncharacterized protein n=1 Tax=Terasakiella brassicae TaxID=1634917 RepID=A0A917FE45_9PROT|nr:hypothetical protein [Terasakiella brassicae]GGF66793.1 hypothetical protein GCM10011332_21140 [Terasakiella brassicae]